MALHLLFDGNAQDNSGNGNNGKVINATSTTDRFGNENSAYAFNGNSKIEINGSQSLQIEGDITMSLWMKPEGTIFENCCNYYPLQTNGNGYEMNIHYSDNAGKTRWNLYAKTGG